MRSPPIALLGALFLACGGATVGVSDAGGVGDSAGAGDSGSGSSGGSSGGGSGSGSGSGSSGGSTSGSSSGSASCNDQLNQINQLRPGAKVCCPTCNHAPCAFVVADLCCPLTVDMQTSNAVVAFENAIKQFKTDGCTAVCPATPCPNAPSGNCDPSSSLCQ